MLCALTTIILSPACLKIFVRANVFILPDSIRSFSTFPGPTDGSWSTSPTRISVVVRETAFSRLLIRITSSIETSSTITTSASIGVTSISTSAFLSSSSMCLISSSLWIVLASIPEVSLSRLAARPVGAQSTTFASKLSRVFIMDFTIVVFPVPGPPVMIETWESSTPFTQFSCSSVNTIPFSSVLAYSVTLNFELISVIWVSFSAMFLSALNNEDRYILSLLYILVLPSIAILAIADSIASGSTDKNSVRYSKMLLRGKLVWPSNDARDSTYFIPAQILVSLLSSIPTFLAIWSATLNEIPLHTSSKMYGLDFTVSNEFTPNALYSFTAFLFPIP